MPNAVSKEAEVALPEAINRRHATLVILQIFWIYFADDLATVHGSFQTLACLCFRQTKVLGLDRGSFSADFLTCLFSIYYRTKPGLKRAANESQEDS